MYGIHLYAGRRDEGVNLAIVTTVKCSPPAFLLVALASKHTEHLLTCSKGTVLLHMEYGFTR